MAALVATTNANQELLGAHPLEKHKNRNNIAWKTLLCTCLTCAGMIGGCVLCFRDDNILAGVLLATSGVLGGVVWIIIGCDSCRSQWNIRKIEAYVREHPTEVYSMVLSGRVMAWYNRIAIGPVVSEEELKRRRKSYCFCFPWLELIIIVPVGIVAIILFFALDASSRWDAIKAPLLTGVIIFLVACTIRLIFQFVPCLCNNYRRRQLKSLSERPGAQDIFFIAAQARNQVAVSFQGQMTWFRNIGRLPVRPPNNSSDKFLAKSQLVAHYSDGQIVAWTLKMVCGVPTEKNNAKCWIASMKRFPVEVSKVQELHDWLMTEPHTSLFRFCGTTFTGPEIRALPATLTSPHNGCTEVGAFPVDHRPAMVLTAILLCDQTGMVRISLMSMAGNEVKVLQMQATDTVANLWWEIDSLPEFAGQRVALLLGNGRSLDDTMTHPMKLTDVMQTLLDPTSEV